MRSLFHSTSSRKHCRSARLGVEGLESRWTPANVTAAVTNGVLNLTAVSAAEMEDLSISSGVTPGSVMIAPGANTTINNNATPISMKGVNSIVISLKGGDDAVAVNDLNLAGGINFQGGDGANNFSMTHSQLGGSLKVVNGNNPMG